MNTTAECNCIGCQHFDLTGFEEDNKDAEQGLEFGYCNMFRRDMQACDFCCFAAENRSTKDGVYHSQT